MLCGLALSPWRKTRSRPARSTMATEVVVPHSASAASAIVKAMRSDTSRCIKTCALATVGTTISTPTAAAAAKRTDMTFSPLIAKSFRPVVTVTGLRKVRAGANIVTRKQPMHQTFSPHETSIRDAITRLCAPFGDAYWLDKDRAGGFPEDFFQAFAASGWLGICIPEAYGGAQLGITEAAIMMQTIAQSGAGLSGASALHMNIFGLNPVAKFGTAEQKARMLPPLVAGRDKACFAVTEPDAGLDTLSLKTRAERSGDRYIVSGQKIWISTAQVATKVLLLARTTPADRAAKRTEGLSLFYTDLDRRYVDIREIEKMGRKAVDSNELFIDGLPVPVEDRIGEEGKGFELILHGMNPERILIAAEAVGLGRAALAKAVGFAKERKV